MIRVGTESPIDVFGATVRGPAHIVAGVPNQDAWRHGRLGGAHVVVVSDGMGSRPFAREGSRAACRAVIDAVREWRRHPDAPLDILLALVHLLWRARVAPRSPGDCACTCLFAVLEQDGSGIVAQLGDGLVVLRDEDGISTLNTTSSKAFANETDALGVTCRISAWTKVQLESRRRTVVLCTDGVAEDLLPDRLDEFTDWLVSDVRSEESRKRRRVLERAFREWPTPHHLDDKTIAVVHVPGDER